MEDGEGNLKFLADNIELKGIYFLAQRPQRVFKLINKLPSPAFLAKLITNVIAPQPVLEIILHKNVKQ
ncbi:hypothetical protein C1631_018640 [Chryseobacterium phosphatilyticum]|uniref:Uncharacterized protein n=1 Tax=Chryseobacterium phosphatilyticum TaxID=475075 RepID=A0A316X4I7_9FLAO|nr:hypothetical protein [Chryseobacterium phosphatilyticum]PWN68695.1 hypothetical protein C1631_018640 [Chryseobacterium phosphatilyticum]